MPQTRIPTPQDFSSLPPCLTTTLIPPSPPESTTSFLILFHGLGDSEIPFANFARSLNLPGVMAISVRGPSPLPPAMLGLDRGGGPTRHWHWGDDLSLSGGELEGDPGFEKARGLVLGELIGEVLVGRCGWERRDVMLFGFGQGGGFALGLARWVGEEGFKGVVSVGGALPGSMIPAGKEKKARTPVLVCRGRESEVVDEEAEEVLRREFEEVRVVSWKRAEDGMPRDRDEVLPMMHFFAGRLRAW